MKLLRNVIELEIRCHSYLLFWQQVQFKITAQETKWKILHALLHQSYAVSAVRLFRDLETRIQLATFWQNVRKSINIFFGFA
jgi:hypothetical protein